MYVHVHIEATFFLVSLPRLQDHEDTAAAENRSTRSAQRASIVLDMTSSSPGVSGAIRTPVKSSAAARALGGDDDEEKDADEAQLVQAGDDTTASGLEVRLSLPASEVFEEAYARYAASAVTKGAYRSAAASSAPLNRDAEAVRRANLKAMLPDPSRDSEIRDLHFPADYDGSGRYVVAKDVRKEFLPQPAAAKQRYDEDEYDEEEDAVSVSNTVVERGRRQAVTPGSAVSGSSSALMMSPAGAGYSPDIRGRGRSASAGSTGSRRSMGGPAPRARVSVVVTEEVRGERLRSFVHHGAAKSAYLEAVKRDRVAQEALFEGRLKLPQLAAAKDITDNDSASDVSDMDDELDLLADVSGATPLDASIRKGAAAIAIAKAALPHLDLR